MKIAGISCEYFGFYGRDSLHDLILLNEYIGYRRGSLIAPGFDSFQDLSNRTGPQFLLFCERNNISFRSCENELNANVDQWLMLINVPRN